MLSLYAVILNTHYVILNVVKNLLNDNTLSTLSMVGFEEIATSGDALLAMTIILSTLSLVDFEEIATSLTALAMTVYCITLAMTVYGIRLGRSFFFFLFHRENEKKKSKLILTTTTLFSLILSTCCLFKNIGFSNKQRIPLSCVFNRVGASYIPAPQLAVYHTSLYLYKK